MTIYDYPTEPFAGAWGVAGGDPPDFGQPDDIADAGIGGWWVNAFGQRLAPGAERFPSDRWVYEPVKQCRGCSAVLGARDPDVCERCDLHDDDTIAVPIPTPVFAPGRLEPGGCRICAEGPVLRVGGDGTTVAFCALHAEAVWQQLTGAISAGVVVQPEEAVQRCSCWESPRHYTCQCSCHDEAVGQ